MKLRKKIPLVGTLDRSFNYLSIKLVIFRKGSAVQSTTTMLEEKLMRKISIIAIVFLFGIVSIIHADLPSKKVLTLDVAKKVAAAAETEANKRGATVVIVVVDDGGYPLVLLRLDNTQVA